MNRPKPSRAQSNPQRNGFHPNWRTTLTTTVTGARLRLLDRKQLLDHLAALSATDPDTRAEAARKAVELLRRKGLSWPTLIQPAERSPDTAEAPPLDWHGEVLALLDHPDIDPADRAFLHKLAGWRAPGADGLRRLREIAARVSGEVTA
jgi:hypothetical protein